MARSNTDCKTELNLKIKAGLIANFCLLALAITTVSLTWLLDIYYMQEPCAKIVHKEVHFLFGIVFCIFLNSIAFYSKGKQIITIKRRNIITIILFLFVFIAPIYVNRHLISEPFYYGIIYFGIGMIFYLIFCKILEMIDSFILK